MILFDTIEVRSRNESLAFRSLTAVALAAGLLWLASGCASLRTGEDASTADSGGTESAHPDSAAEAASAARRTHETPAQVDASRLRFARTVLEQKAGQMLDARQRERVARVLVDAQAKHGLPVILSLAIIELESGFDPAARGPAGSLGLMQIQPRTARALARRLGLRWTNEGDLLDPELNTRLGLGYLAEMQAEFGSADHAVAAYNIGPARLRRLLARHPLERGPYLTKVHANVDALREAYGE